MALVTISGYPASGKTRRAEQLHALLKLKMEEPSYVGPKFKVVILSDDALHIKRDVYDDGRKEKPARASLFTAMQRAIGPNTIVIVDGMNYIKGFRYQMYCQAREHKLRRCTIYIVAKEDDCKAWNESRRGVYDMYSEATLDNLCKRFEEPSSMSQWDSPLFSVPWTDEDIPGDDIWRALTEGIVKPPNAGTAAVAKAPTGALQTLEQTAAAMVSAIMSEQAASQGMGVGEVTLSLSVTLKPKLFLPDRTVTLSELQRLKRQFVTIHKKAITLGTTEKGAVDWTEEKVAEKFVTYLEENMKP